MEATFLSSPSPKLPHIYYRKMITRKLIVSAKQGDQNDGRSVDDNMIVLRMRIKNMKALEAGSKIRDVSNNQEGRAMSEDWMEWEKKLFKNYHEDVWQGIELLQGYFMNTRPSVALGMLALAAMSLPISSSVVMSSALKVARGLLAGCHVCIDIDF